MPENDDDEAPPEGGDSPEGEEDVAEMYGAPGGEDGDWAGGGDTTEGEDDVPGMYGTPGGGDSDGTDDEPDDEQVGANLDAPVLGSESEEMEEVTGRFYVKHTEEIAVTLHEIGTEQIYTLVENPGLETHQILDATIAENPPLGVSYVVEEIHSQETLPVEYSDEPPTRQVQRLVTDMEHDQAVAIEREGEGEIHILHVAPDDVAATAEYVDDDERTYKNAARFGVERVEVRTDEEQGIVSIRYLP